MPTPSSLHIVRRYGPVGGMENYVYQLTRALAKQGQRVTVLCEQAQPLEDTSVHIVELGNSYRKPRWLAQWGFSRRVLAYIRKHLPEGIIHSHERTAVHHVTTFHGPPFANRKKRLLDFLSPRIHMWSYLEKTELLGPQVQAILPNSPLIARQLTQFYPSITDKVLAPAYPAVAPEFLAIKRQTTGLTVGFLGREWHRKGLDIACEVIKQLREHLADVHFVVAGCAPGEINHLFKALPASSYTVLGWLDKPDDFFGQIDVLLHPARAEPFGMVITEANAVGIPVVISDRCGAAALITSQQGVVCELGDPPELGQWVKACLHLLQQPQTVTPLNLSWDKLAEQHIELYRRLSLD